MAFVAVAVMVSTAVSAQQFTDPGFEDWSGATFAGAEQPKYWNYSNVSQLGVDKNFAHKEANGRTGCCLKIQDQFVGVGAIGATSPGYVALGHPWAYVSSLTAINDATAGTYGGINWTYRPDSMVVWIKRTYDSSVDQAAGDHLDEENFHLLYYAWTGTSKGAAYKAKDGSCNTQVAKSKPEYATDEESDIRQALDGNQCGTAVQATQIAEGWYYAKARHDDWTKITVPIYYMSDQVPAKCNVILSAGRYPDFRANSGQYAGSTLFVDDISLKYSSDIQKLYINGREWKAFDPKNHGEQVYSLGQGATVIPEIYAVRGAGSLTNTQGKTQAFAGRRLSNTECTINRSGAAVDGAPVTITVAAEDGSSTSTYTIKFVSQASNNARLSDIKVNGASISGFNAYLNTYNVELLYGTTTAPVVTVLTQDGGATAVITQATSTNGTAKIVVTAQDGTTTQTYTIHFSVAQLSDATLQSILVDGNPLPGYQPSKANYTVSLPLETTTVPTVTWVSAYPTGAQTITIVSNTLEGGCQILVSVPSCATKTYKLTYIREASSYSYLGGIALDGEALDEFAAETFSYNITLPMGTTTLPAITWTKGDPYQTVTKTEAGVEGTTRIVVTAAAGNTTTYRLNFTTEKSSNSRLAGIALNGEALEDFDSDELNYTVNLPAGTTTLPEVTYTTGDDYQTVTRNVNTSLQTVRLVVKAGDGSQSVYTITFVIEKSANALLEMIYLNGDSLAGFAPETSNYDIALDSEVIPVVTVRGAEGQTIAISTPAGFGTARIVVTPEEGVANTYTIVFHSSTDPVLPSFPNDSLHISTDAQLVGIEVADVALDGFAPATTEYTIVLDNNTDELPVVAPVLANIQQVATVEYTTARTAVVTVKATANDEINRMVYTLRFVPTLSENAALNSVEIDGVTFDFVPSTTTYDISLPYGTAVLPDVMYEKGDEQQGVTMTISPLVKGNGKVTISVTAGDSLHTNLYTFNFAVAQSTLPNVLKSIAVDGVGALDLTTGSDFILNLPYGATTIGEIGFVKSFDEQQVSVVGGGVVRPTVITVSSGRDADPDKVYTITPNVPAYDPAHLETITVSGQPLPNFDPMTYNYVLSVDTVPTTFAYLAAEGASVDVTKNTKTARFDVEQGDYMHTYTVTFFYPGDLYFTTSFDQWVDTARTEAPRRTGKYPLGWNTPLTATTSGDAGTYYPENNVNPLTTNKTEGTTAAKLNTTYLITSAEAMPGFVCLSQPSVSVGKWILGIPGLSSSTVLSYGDPVLFRNSPDHVTMDYNVHAFSKLTGWRFIYTANGVSQIADTTSYASLTKDQWYTFDRPIVYEDGHVPSTLEILISSTNTDQISSFGSGYTSEMYIDNLRFYYNSNIAALTVNGVAATASAPARGAHRAPGVADFTAILPSEFYGIPELSFTGAVSDQGQQITWSDEVDGVRTATIRNFAEDGSYTDYVLMVTRPLSTVTDYTHTLTGTDLQLVPGSQHQTLSVTRNDTAYIVTCTSESGVVRRDTISFVQGGTTPTVVTNEPVYPVFNLPAETVKTYPASLSSNTDLADLQINGTTLVGFDASVHSYNISLSELSSVTCTPADAAATTQIVTIKQDETHYAIFAHVIAQDGSTTSYGIEATVRTLRSTALLQNILTDGVALSGFASTTFDYSIELPAGSAIPTLSAIALDDAIVTMNTVFSGSSADVTFNVTAEDGVANNSYVVHVNVQPSAIKTLSMIYLDGVELPNFDSNVLTYSVELPYGTTVLPSVDYLKADKTETVTAIPNVLERVTLHVVAENGDSQDYTINFTVLKSTNANLSSLTVDGTPVAGFDAELLEYDVTLVYGYLDVPEVRYEVEDTTATAVLYAPDQSVATVTVTAEDGVTSKTYTIHYTITKSTNAELDMIYLDGTAMADYDKENLEYTCTYLYGTAMPKVTYTIGDEQQTVVADTVDNVITLTVTAGDGVTINEYVLTFVEKLSDNNYLSDLQVRGTTISGFRRDSTEYILIYPAGTKDSQLLTESDIVATAEDANATVTISSEETTWKIMVTAANGAIRMYVITQIVQLSDDARLKMIYVDSVELRDFDPDVLEYEVILSPGAIMPKVYAVAIDERTEVEYGSFEPIDGDEKLGKYIEMDGVAEDGSRLTYVVSFRYADWSPSADVELDDCLFLPVLGTYDYKAITISIGVSVAVYDCAGHMIYCSKVPVADPGDVTVEHVGDNIVLKEAKSSAEGAVFHGTPATPYFYVFYNSKMKRVAKGGKFMIVR